MVLKVFRSRKFAKKVLISLLVLIIPAFILWGAGSITRRPQPIGQIHRQKIYPADFAKSRQGTRIQVFFTYYRDIDTLNQILKNRPMINFMAWERLILLSEARRKKIRVSNNDVISFISQHPLFQRNGVFSKDIYSYILRNNLSMGPRQFEELVRENLRVKAFRQSLLRNISVTKEELLKHYRETNDKVNLSYIIIDKDLFKDEVTVSADEARKYYEEHRDSFFEPAKVEVEYVELPYENASQKSSIAREIEKIHPEFRKSPARFTELAKSHGLRYGRTGLFSREDVIPGVKFFRGFQEAAFALEEDAISPPVFSSPEKGAAYILHKIRGIPRKPQRFEEVQSHIMEDLAGKKLIALAEKKANNLYTKINGKDTSLEEAANALKQRIKTTGLISSGDYIENVGPAEEIVLRARKTDRGKIIPPVTTGKGVFLARVEDVLPADETGFEKEKETIRRKLLALKQINALEKWFKEHEADVRLEKPLKDL